MLLPMAQLELVGRTDRLDEHAAALQRLRAVELVTEGGVAGDRVTVEHELLDRAAVLLALGAERTGPVAAAEFTAAAIDPAALIEAVEAATRGPQARAEELRAERDALPRTLASLGALLPLVPELRDLTDADLSALHLATIVLVLDDSQGVVRDELATELDRLLSSRHLLTAVADGETVSGLIVVPVTALADVEALLGRDQVATMHLSDRYAGRSLAGTVADMRARSAELPGLIEQTEAQLAAVLADHYAALTAARGELVGRLERSEVAHAAQRGRHTYSVRLWTPRHRIAEVAASVAAVDASTIVAEVARRAWRGTPPVLLRNTRAARPFERLVSFLAWPQSGSLDPTGLMAVMLPILFGIMVGDVGYGLALAGIGWWAGRHFGRRSAVAADVSRVLLVGGAWSTVFGVLYGELFGDLGKTLFNMPALWFYRGGPDALAPLLLFVLGVGVAHLVFGLLLGVWQAARARHTSHLLERLGSLLVLVGLFAVAGALTALLPRGLLTPAAAAMVVGVVLCGVPHGALGLLLGPLEALSTIGSVLSYLRLAAVGLASVYLAIVANELARQAPLVLGVLIAVFFHALNLALAAFSPMIQAMRLHYVEFFGTFFDGGGRPFRPLGTAIEPDVARPEPAAAAVAAPTPQPARPAPVPAFG
ncbi:ATP synthase subunit I [Mycobacterium antarcticum]|uniref:V-type ATPase 116kDa subunit family protein n=1 Tax=Mycolicibacterium sp. TUM20983 TaxID=3023369 RepID=UPI0023957401|nr:V-type ATPase 116kDa subunit family protein [Mycolicibacterium sp. TUM20983]GLP76602.1 ATP synthase subunit I [Mycolicibacterium sp. TUM20983]